MRGVQVAEAVPNFLVVAAIVRAVPREKGWILSTRRPVGVEKPVAMVAQWSVPEDVSE